MLSQQEAERGLVHSLLRKPGEESYGALERLAALPVAVTPEDINDPKLRRLFKLILENAYQEVATSTKLAAQATGVDEFDLVAGTESVDSSALRIYAEAVAYHSARRAINMAASDAMQDAKSKKPGDALDAIHTRFAGISLTSEEERIGTVAERCTEGQHILAHRQQSMANGEIRVAFVINRLNHFVPYLLPGQVVLITGKTKVGKSSFAAQLFDYNVRRGMRGAYFHFEDTPEVMDLRRIARQMATRYDGVPLWKMLGTVLSPADQERIQEVRGEIAGWGHMGTEIYAAGWTMEQVIRTWRRLWLQGRAADKPLDFVVVDYLNKAELTPRKLKAYGLFAGRGRDAELVKQTAEATGTIAFLIQQEGVDGTPYETKQSAQKAQVWLSLVRERLPNHSLDPMGQAIVKNANMGQTGAVPVEFDARWMAWREL
ncbi:MAG: hypothetical protein GWN58_25750 [Anaerolineae bacterium]|nr:hypothetical protein [Anaerolineae bacterium]